MAQPRISRETAQDIKNRMENEFRKGRGYNEALKIVAADLKIPVNTLRTRTKKNGAIVNSHPDLALDFSIIEQPPEITPVIHAEKPRITVRANGIPDGPAMRVCAIGDTHDSPKLPDKERFKWFARHIAATKPDKVVFIGDVGDFESCSTHEPVGSIEHGLRPSYKRDLESLEEALTLYTKELGIGAIPVHILEGNHEYRVVRFESMHPETDGLWKQQLDDVWARYNFRAQPYGEFMFLNGVGFTHAPMTIMGRPYGGKFSENQIGNDTVFSIVYGHTHRAAYRRVPKIGPAQSVEVLNLGSAMPDGYVARYAGTATTGWTYGLYDLELRSGHITDHRFVSMSRLQGDYGD